MNFKPFLFTFITQDNWKRYENHKYISTFITLSLSIALKQAWATLPKNERAACNRSPHRVGRPTKKYTYTFITLSLSITLKQAWATFSKLREQHVTVLIVRWAALLKNSKQLFIRHAF